MTANVLKREDTAGIGKKFLTSRNVIFFCAAAAGGISALPDINASAIASANISTSAEPSDVVSQTEALISSNEPDFSVPLDILYTDEDVSLPHGEIVFNDTVDVPLAYAVSFDTCPDQLVLAHRADVIAAPASLTKVMTLYIAALAMSDENIEFNLNTEIEVPEIAIERARGLANFEDLSVGDRYPLRMFMTGAGSRSDAISTVTIAIATGRALGWEGSDRDILDQFVLKMRQVARAMGMNETGFVNVTGDSGNYGTPEDFLRLMRTASNDAPRVFRIAMGNAHINLPGMTPNTIHSSQFFRNNPNDTEIDKTGFLREAGYNEMGVYRVNSVRVTFSIFGADSKRNRSDIATDIINAVENIDPEGFCSNPSTQAMTIRQAQRRTTQLALAD